MEVDNEVLAETKEFGLPSLKANWLFMIIVLRPPLMVVGDRSGSVVDLKSTEKPWVLESKVAVQYSGPYFFPVQM